MASFKVRRKTISKGGQQIGAGGTHVNELIYGTVSACVPQLTASGPVVAGSISIPGLDADAKIFFTSASGGNGVVITTASVTGAGAVSASYGSVSHSATNASVLTFHYLALS